MNKVTREKAITMVALVVTVIVLLILAGVTVNLVLDDNGILVSAQISSNTYANKTKQETLMFENFDTIIREESSEDRTLVGLFKSEIIKVGDYINYEVPKNGNFTTTAYGNDNSNGFAEQTYNVNNNGNEIKWRVLGLGDDSGNLTLDKNQGKHILLISSTPVQKTVNINSENEYDRNPYLYIGKAECYQNGVQILNSICNIYSNTQYAMMGRSINANDLNTLLGIEVKDGIVYEKEDTNKNNIDILRTIDKSYNYTEGNYSAESYLKNKTALENEEVYVLGTGYSYLVSYYKDRKIGSTTIGDLLFNQTSYESKNAKAYWLANKGIEINRKVGFGIGEVCYDSVNIGVGKFYSNGSWIVEGRAVYPIIMLKSNLTNQDLNVTSGNEAEWNYNNNLNFSGNVENYRSNEQMNLFY